MAKTTITREEILKDLKRAYYREEIKDDEITARMQANNTGSSTRAARNQLEKEVRKGRMKRREAQMDGKQIIAYSIINHAGNRLVKGGK